MPNVLTVGSTVKCVHQGTVQLVASQSLLKVDGDAILVEGDLNGALISGCTPASQSSKPCTMVTGMTLGLALKLKVGGKAALLETAMGTTDGMPTAPVLWNVQTAGQTKLVAS